MCEPYTDTHRWQLFCATFACSFYRCCRVTYLLPADQLNALLHVRDLVAPLVDELAAGVGGEADHGGDAGRGGGGVAGPGRERHAHGDVEI